MLNMSATADVRLAILLLFAAKAYASTCTIDLNKDVTANSPLVLSMDSLQPIYPQRGSSDVLKLNSGQKHLLYCPGGVIRRSNRATDSSTEISKCTNGKSFASVPERSREYSFRQVKCSEDPDPVTRPYPNRKCMADGSGMSVEIGYEIKNNGFKKTIDLCHIKRLATTSWAHSTIHGAIGGSKPGKDGVAPAFSKGDFFENVSMNQVYPQRNQVKTFMKIFNGNRQLVDRYLPRQKSRVKNYLVRGHLVARADQLYFAEQYSTYSYLNVLPMWQSINNGNWKSIETTVRRTSGVIGDLEVYTGGIGILKLSEKEIYLTHDKSNPSKLLIPVPKLLFKLVYSPTARQALVFVTANNPYLTEVPADYRLCRNREYKKYNSRNFDQKYEGFSYACLYEDFMAHKAVKALNLPLTLKNVGPLNLQ